MDYRDELRAKKPAKAQSADYGNSKTAAIALHCETCIGSIAEAAQCPAFKYFLWPYRPGNGSTERAAVRTRFLGEDVEA